MNIQGAPRSEYLFPSFYPMVGYGEVCEEWGKRVPHLRARDRVGPNLGEGSVVDESVGDRHKQWDYHKQGLPHSRPR